MEYGSEKEITKHKNAVSSMKVCKIKELAQQDEITYYTMIKRILLIVEDNGYAYEFYKRYLETNYTGLDITIVGMAGFSNLKYALTEYYNEDKTHVILIYDKGVDSKGITSIQKAIRRFERKNDKKIIQFAPLCFEHILISFELLRLVSEPLKKPEQLNIDFHEDVIKCLKGTQDDIDYSKYICSYKSKEALCEFAIEDLTKDTPYECIHGGKDIKGCLSDCWITNCCDSGKKTNECKILNHTLYKKNNKMDLIASTSLLCGLTFILDCIYGWEFRNYSQYLNKKYIESMIVGV